MEGRVMLWCNNHLSTHGMEVHGRRLSAWVLGGDQEYPVLSWILEESTGYSRRALDILGEESTGTGYSWSPPRRRPCTSIPRRARAQRIAGATLPLRRARTEITWALGRLGGRPRTALWAARNR